MSEVEKGAEIVEYLNGTCKSTGDAANKFDVDEDVVLEAVIAGEIECCVLCGWWDETSAMEIIDDEHHCADCLDHDPNED